MIPCKALVVLCVAGDQESLRALKRAAVGAEWELAPGATDAEEALRQLEQEGAHVVVVYRGAADVVERLKASRPWMRVVTVGPAPGADVEVGSLDEVRGAILGRSAD